MTGHEHLINTTIRSNQEHCAFCEQFDSPPRPPNGKFKGLLVAGLFGFSGAAILAVAFPFIRPAFRRICLPYVPATDAQVDNVLKSLSGRKGTLVDLGSGDGRIVSSCRLMFVSSLTFVHLGICSSQARVPVTWS